MTPGIKTSHVDKMDVTDPVSGVERRFFLAGNYVYGISETILARAVVGAIVPVTSSTGLERGHCDLFVRFDEAGFVLTYIGVGDAGDRMACFNKIVKTVVTHRALTS